MRVMRRSCTLDSFHGVEFTEFLMRQFSKQSLIPLALVFLLTAPSAHAIKKCKDAEGKWHYGDNADELCQTTKVTTLDSRGFVKETLEAPKTEEEKLVEAELKRKEQEELARIKKEDEERDRILSIYERESDIDRQRDNKLASVEGNIRVHRAYLKQMDSKIKRLESKSATAKGLHKQNLDKEIVASKSRVVEFSAELKRLEEQKISIAEKFATEKKLYREYRGDQS